MICANCGTEIPDESILCPNCGSDPIATVSAVVEEPAPAKSTSSQATINYSKLSKAQYKDAKAAYKAARKASSVKRRRIAKGGHLYFLDHRGELPPFQMNTLRIAHGPSLLDCKGPKNFFLFQFPTTAPEKPV